jgi:hypothetical protein
MRRSRRISGLLLVSLLGLAVVPAVRAAGISRIALRPSNAYPAVRGAAPEPTGQDEAILRAQDALRRWPRRLSFDSV